MKKIYIIILFVLITTNGFAQSSLWTINWPIAFPQGDTKDFIDKTSFRGISVDGRSLITDNLSIGGSAGWHILYQKKQNEPPLSIDNDEVSGDVSGTQFRYLNAVPLLANAHYYLDVNKAKAYFGAGLGTIYAEEKINVGLSSFHDKSWRFGFQPEIGFFMPFKYSDVGINLSLRYLYGTSAGEADPISMFAVGVGFGFFKY